MLVVIDTAYRHYATAPDYSDGIRFIEMGYPVITLNTFSKIYGLAGIRVGYGVASEGIIRTLLQVKEPFNVNAGKRRHRPHLGMRSMSRHHAG